MFPLIALGLGALGFKFFYYDTPAPVDALTMCSALVSAPSGSAGDLQAVSDLNGGWLRGHKIMLVFSNALAGTGPISNVAQTPVPPAVALTQIAACLQAKGYFTLAQQFLSKAATSAGLPISA